MGVLNASQARHFPQFDVGLPSLGVLQDEEFHIGDFHRPSSVITKPPRGIFVIAVARMLIDPFSLCVSGRPNPMLRNDVKKPQPHSRFKCANSGVGSPLSRSHCHSSR